MSRNLYKASWVVVTDDDKCVIDSNSLLERRIEELEILRQTRLNAPVGYGDSEEEGEGEFVSGLGGEEIDALLADSGEGGPGRIIKGTPPQEPVPDLEEVKAQAQQMIDDAQARVSEIMESASKEIDIKRRKALEDADRQGYDEGYKRGYAEADGMKRALADEKRRLEEQYDRLIEELEPRFIDTITEIYSHIFGTALADNRDILVHLIDSTLRRVESSRTFIVHVSKEDYPYVNIRKQALSEGATAGKGTVEIIEDVALGQGACLIETDGGIFDCGVDTQLQELTNKLRVLSFEKSNH